MIGRETRKRERKKEHTCVTNERKGTLEIEFLLRQRNVNSRRLGSGEGPGQVSLLKISDDEEPRF